MRNAQGDDKKKFRRNRFILIVIFVVTVFIILGLIIFNAFFDRLKFDYVESRVSRLMEEVGLDDSRKDCIPPQEKFSQKSYCFITANEVISISSKHEAEGLIDEYKKKSEDASNLLVSVDNNSEYPQYEKVQTEPWYRSTQYDASDSINVRFVETEGCRMNYGYRKEEKQESITSLSITAICYVAANDQYY